MVCFYKVFFLIIFNNNFNLFSDSKTYGENLFIDNETHQINESKFLEIKIDSFSVPLNYSFNMERLPMDRLLLNNRTIKSNQCQKQEYPALKCLQSDLLQLNLKKCTENYTLSFDYSYDNAEIYETVAILKPKYEHKIRLLCNYKFKTTVKTIF